MTGPELRALLAECRLTRAALAQDLDVDERTVRRWLSGVTPIPKAAAIAIRALTKRKAKAR